MISYPYTYINHQNQPSMYVNLNNTWILWEMGTMYNHVTCLIPPQKKKTKHPGFLDEKIGAPPKGMLKKFHGRTVFPLLGHKIGKRRIMGNFIYTPEI